MSSARAALSEAYQALEHATSYPEWLEAARRYDELSGGMAWRQEDDSPHYHAASLKDSMATMRRLRERSQGARLARVLDEDLYRHLNDLSSAELYGHAMSGSKLLVEAYLQEVEDCLHWLARTEIPGLSRRRKRERFELAYRVYGRSALLLSGGATWGFHHLGVVKALFEHDLLPGILSGASTGAMIAAGMCTRSDAELRELFARPDQLRLDGLAPVGPRRALRQSALLDPAHLRAVLDHNIGPWTFAEACERSGRALNISVAPTRSRQKPRLLTHLTAPDVLVASAAMASSALPTLFPPMQLERRLPDGRVCPYIPGERWVDGSLGDDLPKARLGRLHNVNHFIVSQVNPYVVPFTRHHGRRGLRPALAGLIGATARSHGVYTADLARRATRGSGPAGMLAQWGHALVSQDYKGDITIHPPFSWKLYRKVVANPSPADLRSFIRSGERAVWPLIPLIRDQTRLGRVFESCLRELRSTREPPAEAAPG